MVVAVEPSTQAALVSREGCGRSSVRNEAIGKTFRRSTPGDSRRRQQPGSRLEERGWKSALRVTRAGRADHRRGWPQLRGHGVLVGTADLRSCACERVA